MPAKNKNQVWIRNRGLGCEFTADGKRCGSQHALQIDHVRGFARGGRHDVENLRVLCAKHNRFEW
ncbi:MAG: HNH endonuclease, partial [Proteobacteria bacterium]